MQTRTGNKIPLPGSEDGRICPFDIVYSLGKEGRFGNQTILDYTVLHHSMLVSMIWVIAEYPLDKMVYAAFHDFHEYALKDIPTTIKNCNSDFKKSIKEIESFLDKKIFDRFYLNEPDEDTKKMVKICDIVAFIVEALMIGPSIHDMDFLYTVYPSKEVWDLVSKVMPNLEQAAKTFRK